MSNKQLLLGLGGLIVLGAIFAGLASLVGPADTAPTAGDKSPVLGGTLEADGDYHYKEEGAGYVIEAEYPAHVPLPTKEAGDKAADTLEHELAKVIGVFKADAAQMLDAQEVARLQEAGVHYAFELTYTDYAAEGYHSYAYQVYQDTGGAHPNGFYLTYVFDVGGNLVALEDLFEPGSSYLQMLSQLVYPKVVAELSARTGSAATPEMLETVRMGTSPTPEALQFFYITNEALHLLFPPYQVASYAAGSFDIAIPWTQLAGILK